MKRITFLLLAATITFFVSSCKKDSLVPGCQNGCPPVPSITPFTVTLVAWNWVKGRDGTYVNTFQNINSSGKRIEVYLVTEGKEIQINGYNIPYQGGELWATTIDKDLKINFRYSADKLPFSFLNIKVALY